MRFEVLLTEDAEQDLEDLYAYIAKFDSLKNADCVAEHRPRNEAGKEEAGLPMLCQRITPCSPSIEPRRAFAA